LRHIKISTDIVTNLPEGGFQNNVGFLSSVKEKLKPSGSALPPNIASFEYSLYRVLTLMNYNSWIDMLHQSSKIFSFLHNSSNFHPVPLPFTTRIEYINNKIAIAHYLLHDKNFSPPCQLQTIANITDYVIETPNDQNEDKTTEVNSSTDTPITSNTSSLIKTPPYQSQTHEIKTFYQPPLLVEHIPVH